MALDVRVVDVNLDLARGAPAHQRPVGDRRAVQIERAPPRKVVGRDPAVVLTDERHGRGRFVLVQLVADALADRVDQL